MNCGVPQESILEPLVFIVYFNDHGEYLTECETSLYAYDTALYASSPPYIDMLSVSEWIKLNK